MLIGNDLLLQVKAKKGEWGVWAVAEASLTPVCSRCKTPSGQIVAKQVLAEELPGPFLYGRSYTTEHDPQFSRTG